MGKRVILYLFLLFSLSLQAQTEEKVSLGNDSTEVDSTTTAKPSAFKRAIKKFMNFSDFDTLYISPNRYNYALMVTHFSNFEYYSITSELPQPQKLSFSPNPHNKIGLYFGWRWIFLGWSVDVNDIFKKVPERTEEQNSILAYTVPNWVWISSIAALVMITKYIKSEDFQTISPPTIPKISAE